MDKQREQVVFISYDEAINLVDRIANRTKDFNHEMSEPEKEAMADLLSNIGVRVSDLIDVDRLADEYSINAELVTPDEVDEYSQSSLDDALFSWNEPDGRHYCISW